MYGGAAGGGKTVALLMAALMFVGVPGYAALLLRKSYPNLGRAGQLIPLSQEWLGGTTARYNESKHLWTFPSGATIQFGHLENAADLANYRGPSFQFIGFDELTEFEERSYLFMFRSLRKPEGLPVPLRMRSATNPGGVGHHWVYRRFIKPKEMPPSRAFIPSRLDENPYLDQESYELGLEQLPPVLREQQRWGNWEIIESGGVFDAAALQRQRANLYAGHAGSLVEV